MHLLEAEIQPCLEVRERVTAGLKGPKVHGFCMKFLASIESTFGRYDIYFDIAVYIS